MTKFTSIDAYIDSTEGTQRERLEVIRALFHRLVPDVEELISYNIPAFTVGRHHLYISSFAHHIAEQEQRDHSISSILNPSPWIW